MREKKLTRMLAEHYRSRGYLAKPLVNLSVMGVWRESSWPAQPEVDLLISPLKGYIPGHIEAHEVKLFRFKFGCFDRSFYEGLDETLALLGIGADYCVLEILTWDFSDTERSLHYFEPLVFLVKNLQLPVGLMFRGVDRTGDIVRFTEPIVKITPKLNPLLKHSVVRASHIALQKLFHISGVSP